MKLQPDLSRLRIEPEDRERRFAGSDLYSCFNAANLFAVQYTAISSVLDPDLRRRMSEIRSSFPECRIDYHRITLAPPKTRKLAPISWGYACSWKA